MFGLLMGFPYFSPFGSLMSLMFPPNLNQASYNKRKSRQKIRLSEDVITEFPTLPQPQINSPAPGLLTGIRFPWFGPQPIGMSPSPGLKLPWFGSQPIRMNQSPGFKLPWFGPQPWEVR